MHICGTCIHYCDKEDVWPCGLIFPYAKCNIDSDVECVYGKPACERYIPDEDYISYLGLDKEA